jgi:hypothetical protein
VHRLVDAISTSLKCKQYCSCVFLDIPQAKSYLTDRYFQIHIGFYNLQIAIINAGVPQGGILSLLLFNIYASNQSVFENTLVVDYIDDKVIISIYENPLIASGNLQTHLNLISSWYTK